MGIKCLLIAIGLIALTTSCVQDQPEGDPLEIVLSSDNPDIKRVMDSLEQYEVQVRYTRIDRIRDSVVFNDYDFQVEAANYFYPASTVKFPTAVLALERLHLIDSLSMYDRFYVEGDTIETTIANDISKIFAVSDNEANNRLFEFLGQDAINKGLSEKGISPVRISHRLGTQNHDLTTKPIIIYLNDSTTATLEPTINREPIVLDLKKTSKGSGYYDGDSLIQEPFDFSLKNYYPIAAQHGLLKRVVFPQCFPKEAQFQLSADQRDLLLTAMHTLPRAVGYDPREYYDGYCKFFMYGDTKEAIPDHIKIYNKVGLAYGTLTDCAYILDTKNKVEFLLTATILVNKDGVFNDDRYDYEEVGIPFLAALGKEIYASELARKK